jgi:nitrate/nitrite-specific signal transduction histidine kinase
MNDRPTDETHGRLDFPTGIGAELLTDLRSTLEKATGLLRVLEENLHNVAEQQPGGAAGDKAGDLERRLARTEADVNELASQLAASERQTSRLMNLYVATYQLHSSLEPSEVQRTIAEIAINLLGAERFALLLRQEDSENYEVAQRFGLGAAEHPMYGEARYPGGDPMVDATLADGVLRLGPSEGSSALAVVPLRVQGEFVGAIVLLKLLNHKPALRGEDRELLDLLSAHAASALFAARVFASKDRKLRTLEGLVKLARGE